MPNTAHAHTSPTDEGPPSTAGDTSSDKAKGTKCLVLDKPLKPGKELAGALTCSITMFWGIGGGLTSLKTQLVVLSDVHQVPQVHCFSRAWVRFLARIFSSEVASW